jgi:hypothetical protein
MNALACPVQSQHNADERKAEALEREAAALEHAIDYSIAKIKQAILSMPKETRTPYFYQGIIAILRALTDAELKNDGASDGLLNAYIALDKAS